MGCTPEEGRRPVPGEGVLLEGEGEPARGERVVEEAHRYPRWVGQQLRPGRYLSSFLRCWGGGKGVKPPMAGNQVAGENEREEYFHLLRHLLGRTPILQLMQRSTGEVLSGQEQQVLPQSELLVAHHPSRVGRGYPRPSESPRLRPTMRSQRRPHRLLQRL